MGWFDLFSSSDRHVTLSALQEAEAHDGTDDAVTKLIKRLTSVGIDGVGPYPSAATVAASALEKEKGDVDAAVRRVQRWAGRGAAAGGFVTSLGGFLTMIVAIPVNVFSFYVQATRMAAAVAVLRGYDVNDERIRTAILLTLVGSNAADILTNAGVATGSNAALQIASRGGVPRPALMVIQKAVGFRILRSVGERIFTRLGKLIPLAGGAFGAVIDYAMMRRISAQARIEFPG